MEINKVVYSPKFVYPVARRDETIVDDYHGQKVTGYFILAYFIFKLKTKA